MKLASSSTGVYRTSAAGIEVTKVMMNSTPVMKDVLLVESIGTPFVPVVWLVDGDRCGISFPG
jgi:hypothetical protein